MDNLGLHDNRQRARPFTEGDVGRLLAHCDETRYPLRNRVVVLLTYDAGLGVSEISRLRRSHIMKDGLPAPELQVQRGQNIRTVPMTDRLFAACLNMLRGLPGSLDTPFVLPERCDDMVTPMRPDSIAYLLYRLIDKAGLEGASSHSGRRSFMQRAILAARNEPGVTLNDVKVVGGLARIEHLRPYDPSTAGSPEGRRRLVKALTK